MGQRLEGSVPLVAFYLPQYHPIPENEEWWGPGFTEWTSVGRARPLFRGHAQPVIPGELGFYDLRLPETRAAQAELAAEHGVSGFAYWHYWFGDGRRLLERPFDEVLASGEPDFPFCLAWANQTWTGIWHGAADRVLIEQRYPGEADERAHFSAVLPALRDSRYLRVDGRPLFYVFRPEQLPEPGSFIDHWRALAEREGLAGLYFVAEISDLHGTGPSYTRWREDGFDDAVYIRLPFERTTSNLLAMRARRKLLRWPEVYPYADRPVATPAAFADAIPCVYPNWDNTPRSGRRGLVLAGSTPEKFRTHLRSALEIASRRHPQHQLLFVKSWNEWAEGNHLEPDLAHGRGYLEVVRDEVQRASS